MKRGIPQVMGLVAKSFFVTHYREVLETGKIVFSLVFTRHGELT